MHKYPDPLRSTLLTHLWQRLQHRLRLLGYDTTSYIVQLEGEPSPQSGVLSTLEQVFIKDLSVLCSVHLCLYPD
jgi:hypothetical protein